MRSVSSRSGLPTSSSKTAQVLVLDTGGQYCHLIARKVRELGVSAEVCPSETPAGQLSGARALIISGGPNSVYDPGSPTVDPAIFASGQPVLGICYGQQLMAHVLGGEVQKGDVGEYGLATLQLAAPGSPLFSGAPAGQQIWMSHRDTVAAVPPGFHVLGATSTCPVAAISDSARRLYGVQFHPEVVHTTHGRRILSNFLFDISGCEQDWSPRRQIDAIEEEIRNTVGDRNVFFFISGGVDSTVAFTLCLRALGPERLRGVYVDTGLMREGETEFVRRLFDLLDSGVVDIEYAEKRFLPPLAAVCDPEQKRRIIGEEFVRVQERVIEERHLLDGHWILGQGTIYPDTIESGGTQKAAVIKTHHNRVPGIQRLMAANRIVEPLSAFYKDEVREIGRALELPAELLDRHPFPGPGLAIRCLCSESERPVVPVEDGYLVPLRSVGVQGDSRTYAPVLALDCYPSAAVRETAAALINRISGVNRVVTRVASHTPLASMRIEPRGLTTERLARLRRADSLVRGMSHASGFDRQIWQFPVILIPLGTPELPDSVVLRPVDSIDGMTAQSVVMENPLLGEMADALLRIEGICGVFHDLTHKPPGTIEWE